MTRNSSMPDCSGFLNHSHLEEIAQPAHEALLDLIHSCPDAHTRTTVVTALVLSIWQYANRVNSPIKPSLVLVNATGNAYDPVLAAMGSLLGLKDKLDPMHQKTDGYVGTPEKARESMHNIVELIRSPEGQFVDRKAYEKMYHSARRTAYGLGSIHNYSEAWHPKLGLVTGRSNTTTLLVDAEKDKSLFREHLLNNPGKVSSPSGVGAGLNTVWKSMQVSASMSPSECDVEVVDAIMELGRPYIILPHVVNDLINIPNVHSVSHYAKLLRRDWVSPIEPRPSLPGNDWCESYQEYLWSRLGRLPMAYRYPILELVHRLENTCDLIAECAGLTAGGVCLDDLAPLKVELYAHSLRGITLSLAGLAWYGLGIELESSLAQARKLLRRLRENGQMTLRDIQRAVGFKTSAERDAVIHCLAKEGLLRCEGKIASAATYPDFILGLGRRHGLPDVSDLSEEDSAA